MPTRKAVLGLALALSLVLGACVPTLPQDGARTAAPPAPGADTAAPTPQPSDAPAEDPRARASATPQRDAAVGAPARAQPSAPRTPVAVAVPALSTYVNAEYGFSLLYPTGWEVEEVPSDGTLSPAVHLSSGSTRLILGYRRADDGLRIETDDIPGDLQERGAVQLLGKPISRQVLALDGKDKAVYYNRGQPVAVGDLVFGIALLSFASDLSAVSLSDALQAAADDIVSSVTLALPETEGLSSDGRPIGSGELTAVDATWNQYTNRELGLSLRLPKAVYHYYGACADAGADAQGVARRRPKPAPVPLTVWVSDTVVYIGSAYYYEPHKPMVEAAPAGGSRTYYGECLRVVNGPERLSEPSARYQVAWAMQVVEAENVEMLQEQIRATYGAGCRLVERVREEPSDVVEYGVRAEGAECPLGDTTLWVAHRPAAGRAVILRRRDVTTFWADAYFARAYDAEMLSSLRLR